MKHLLLLALLPTVALAAAPSADKLDPGLDATVMHSRAKLTNEFIARDDNASKNTTKLNLAYAFGNVARHDWNVQIDLPIVAYRAGQTPGAENATGFGDLEMRIAHVVDAEGLFRWGFGLETQLNTASAPPLGDGIFRLTPAVAFALQPCRAFKFQTLVQYDQSLAHEDRVPQTEKLKLKPSVQFDLPAGCYAYAETELTWDFKQDGQFSAKLKTEIGRGWGPRQEWITSIRYETPLTESTDIYTITAGLTYVFP